jgi:hypothetical protein
MVDLDNIMFGLDYRAIEKDEGDVPEKETDRVARMHKKMTRMNLIEEAKNSQNNSTEQKNNFILQTQTEDDEMNESMKMLDASLGRIEKEMDQRLVLDAKRDDLQLQAIFDYMSKSSSVKLDMIGENPSLREDLEFDEDMAKLDSCLSFLSTENQRKCHEEFKSDLLTSQNVAAAVCKKLTPEQLLPLKGKSFVEARVIHLKKVFQAQYDLYQRAYEEAVRTKKNMKANERRQKEKREKEMRARNQNSDEEPTETTTKEFIADERATWEQKEKKRRIEEQNEKLQRLEELKAVQKQEEKKRMENQEAELTRLLSQKETETQKAIEELQDEIDKEEMEMKENEKNEKQKDVERTEIEEMEMKEKQKKDVQRKEIERKEIERRERNRRENEQRKRLEEQRIKEERRRRNFENEKEIKARLNMERLKMESEGADKEEIEGYLRVLRNQIEDEIREREGTQLADWEEL